MPTQSTQVLLLTPASPQDPIRRILRDAGYRVVVANSVTAAVRTAERGQPGLILADPQALTPPSRDELESFAAKQSVPLVVGWADHESLLAQVQEAIVPQEAPGEESQKLAAGSLQVDLARRVARLDDIPLDLTPREFDLLCHFVRHPGWVFSRQELLEQVWGYEFGDPQVVTVQIASLRKKAKAVAPDRTLIETVPKVGYRLAEEPGAQPAPGPAEPASQPAPSAASTGPPSRRRRTRMIVGSVVVGVLVVGLGLGLWFGLVEGGGPAPVSGAGGPVAEDQSAVVRWGPQIFTEGDEQGNVFWQASFWIIAAKGYGASGTWGSEVMNLTVTLPPRAPLPWAAMRPPTSCTSISSRWTMPQWRL